MGFSLFFTVLKLRKRGGFWGVIYPHWGGFFYRYRQLQTAIIFYHKLQSCGSGRAKRSSTLLYYYLLNNTLTLAKSSEIIQARGSHNIYSTGFLSRLRTVNRSSQHIRYQHNINDTFR